MTERMTFPTQTAAEISGGIKPRELFLRQTPNGTLALFDDVSDLEEGLLITEFWKPDKHLVHVASSGFRKCFTLQVNDQTLYIKPKRSNAKPSILEDLHAMTHILSGNEEHSNINYRHKLLVQDLHMLNSRVSVLHEILLLEELKRKYLKKYDEPLPVEESVGAFLSKDKSRFTIYKEVPGADITSQMLNHTHPLLSHYHSWINRISARITSLGFIIGDLQAVCTNNNSAQNSPFVLIDTESWYKSSGN